MIASLAIKTPFGPRLVDLDFGGKRDALSVARWRSIAGLDSPAARDAMEYSRLAGKRWRYYAARSETATTLAQLRERIARSPAGEVGFLLIARVSWSEKYPLLGMCWCRRTWCNHLVLDFAAVHPAALSPGSGFGGIGTIMLQALALVARHVRSPLIWGEATELSASFYEKVLGIRNVKDHFFVRRPVLRKLQNDADAQTKSAHGEKNQA